MWQIRSVRWSKRAAERDGGGWVGETAGTWLVLLWGGQLAKPDVGPGGCVCACVPLMGVMGSTCLDAIRGIDEMRGCARGG